MNQLGIFRITLVGLSVVMSTLAAAAAGPALSITAIDVDGGAATLYVTPEHRSLLIDSGWPAGFGPPKKTPDEKDTGPLSSADRIVAAAKAAGLTRIDYVLITHYHVDHVGGVEELVGKFPIGTFLDHGPNRELSPPGLPAAYASFQTGVLYPKYLKVIDGHPHRSLAVGDQLQIGSLQLTVLTSDRQTLPRPLPGAGEADPRCAGMTDMAADGGEENSRSVGLLLTFGKARIVSLGDLTWNVERSLVCPNNKIGHANLFFVSHHGANWSNSPALVQALSPTVAIMGNGATKGADPETYDTLSASRGLKRLWQLHFAEKGGKDHNAPDPYIANLSAEGDLALPLMVAVYTDGSLTVTNPRNGLSESYGP